MHGYNPTTIHSVMNTYCLDSNKTVAKEENVTLLNKTKVAIDDLKP